MPIQKFETTILDSITNAMRYNQAKGLLLGGIAGSGGGEGGPPGGFIGYLPQTKVAYDLSEEASSGIAVSGSLVDNLNHIRYRLEIVESGVAGGTPGHIIKDNSTTYAQRGYLKFLGGADVLDDAANDTTIVTISGGGGPGGGGHTIENEGVELSARTYLDFVGRGVTATDDVFNDKTIVTVSGMPWFNVKEFGAIANGIVNDNAAVESGIAALNAAGGGVLYFPAGTYLVDGDFSDLSSNCVVMGDGGSINGQLLDSYTWERVGDVSGLSVLQLVDNNPSAIFSTSAKMAIFKDFAIIADSATPEASYGVEAYNPSSLFQRVCVYNCSFIGFQYGIYLVNGDSCEIKGNTILGGGMSAMLISDVTNFVIEGNRFICIETANEALDVYWDPGADSICRGRINSNYFYSSQDPNVAGYSSFCWQNAISVGTPISGAFLDISNNYFDAISLYAIEISVNDGQADSRITITDNVMVTNVGGGTGHAIYVGKTYGTNNPNMGLIISGNIFKSGGTPTQAAIQLEQVKQVVVVGNKNINFPTLISATSTTDIRVEDVEHTVSTAAPTTTDDITKGHSLGDIWTRSTTSGVYVCVNNTASAAAWSLLPTSLSLYELLSNKTNDTTLAGDSATLYPTEHAVKTYVDNHTVVMTGYMEKSVYDSDVDGIVDNSELLQGHNAAYFQTALGYTAENQANKSNDTTMAGDSSTLYPTQHAVKAYVDAAAISGVVVSGSGGMDITFAWAFLA